MKYAINNFKKRLEMRSGNNENINKHNFPAKRQSKHFNKTPETNIVFSDEEVKAASKRAMDKYRDAYVELAKYDSN
jgi:hypothetical protein